MTSVESDSSLSINFFGSGDFLRRTVRDVFDLVVVLDDISDSIQFRTTNFYFCIENAMNYKTFGRIINTIEKVLENSWQIGFSISFIYFNGKSVLPGDNFVRRNSYRRWHELRHNGVQCTVYTTTVYPKNTHTDRMVMFGVHKCIQPDIELFKCDSVEWWIGECVTSISFIYSFTFIIIHI